MAKGKKYDYRIVKDDLTWTGEIIRKITSKKTVVTISQGLFPTEEAAENWAKKELERFVKNLSDRNKIRSSKRK